MAIVKSVNIGSLGKIAPEGKKTYDTGIFKKPVQGAQELGLLGLANDVVVDRRYHGGRDKALCFYFSDNFSHLNSSLGLDFCPGAFGENLTIEGLDETGINIGDSFQIGSAIVQCTEPRQPCFKLVEVHKSPSLFDFLKESGYTGGYMRVLKEGKITAGDEFRLISGSPRKFSIAKANQLLYKDKKNIEMLEEILSIDELSSTLRKQFQNRLEKSISA